MKQFAHLHVHTEFSLLDGAVRTDKVFRLCDEKNVPAIAMTDHGNMHGAIEFLKAAVKYTDHDAEFFAFMRERRPFKVKPILGCEVYMNEDMHKKEGDASGAPSELNHFVLLAKNGVGYHNLMKIVSAGYIEGMYEKPRVDFEYIKAHSEGIIVLSGCLDGVIPQAILKNDFVTADEWIKKFKAVFGEDFYLEIQNHGIDEQKTILPHLLRLAKENDVKAVATNDAHYLTKADAEMQKVLTAISCRAVLKNDAPEADGEYLPTDEFYVKDYDEMYAALPYADALATTLEIADKCDPYFIRKESLVPTFVSPDGSESARYLRKLTFDGLKVRYGEIPEQVRARTEYELKVIEKLRFEDYFLIVWDVIRYVESQEIPVGPGRGSSVGSIVAYALGITKIDPLKYNLIFERFLNPECVCIPDIDIDVCRERRGEVIDYIARKYGADNVSEIAALGTMTAKSSVKDVGRVYGYPYDETEKIAKLIPYNSKRLAHILGFAKWKDNEPSPVIGELREMYESNERARKILDIAMKTEGMPRRIGTHVCGVIICRDAIADHVPLARSDEGDIVTQYDFVADEKLGLFKLDVLQLTVLDDIKKATEYIKQRRGVEIDFDKLGYDDPKVYELMGSGDIEALFGFYSGEMAKFMRELQPSGMEDMIASISLDRPALSDVISEFIRKKKDSAKNVYLHPSLEPILRVTYGIILYQEQVMEILHKLGGYSMGAADVFRRNVRKKNFAQLESEREVFINGSKKRNISGAVANGVPKGVAGDIYDMLIKFASDAFIKSHAAAYAHITYQTAYLKRYYPAEYFAAVILNRKNRPDELAHYLSYMKEAGITLLE